MQGPCLLPALSTVAKQKGQVLHGFTDQCGIFCVPSSWHLEFHTQFAQTVAACPGTCAATFPGWLPVWALCWNVNSALTRSDTKLLVAV